MKMKLTEKAIDRLVVPASKAQLVVWDHEVPGLGVVVGRRTSTFVANYWANGVKRRQVIGRRGEIRDEGDPLTVTLARQRAKEILGKVAGGGDPSIELRKREGGPTRSDAFDLHISRMRADQASASSIATITRERDKYLEKWMNRPAREDRARALSRAPRATETRREQRSGASFTTCGNKVIHTCGASCV